MLASCIKYDILYFTGQSNLKVKLLPGIEKGGTMQVFVHVNYIAVLFCGVISIVISLFWYSPMLLGKIWLDSIEKTEEEIEKELKSFKTYIFSFIGHILLAYALAQVMASTQSNTSAEGMRLGFLCWIGFTASTMLINYTFEGGSFKRFFIDGGYHLIVLLIFGLILGAWSA